MDNQPKSFEDAKIKPVAYNNDLSGVKFIVEINRSGEKTHTMVNPPSYELRDEYNESLPASAITGHYFTPYDGESYSYEEYKGQLSLLGEKLSGLK